MRLGCSTFAERSSGVQSGAAFIECQYRQWLTEPAQSARLLSPAATVSSVSFNVP